MWTGHYDVNVLADGHKWVCALSLQASGRQDYDLARADLGQPAGVCAQKY
jgi:hypothetical protein